MMATILVCDSETMQAHVKTKVGLRGSKLRRHDERLCFLAETLWLRPGLREQVGSAARLIEKGVVCWSHVFRGLLLAKPIRMFGERR